MNCASLILTLHIALLCIGTSVLARPSRTSRQRGGSGRESLSDRNAGNGGGHHRDSNHNSNKRPRSSRRFRMLQKILKNLTPDDMIQLARAKKDSSLGYGYGGRYTEGPPSHLGETTLLNKVECPVTDHDMHMFACPSPDQFQRYECIDVRALCNDKFDCPNGEDENKTVCMFHKMHMNYFKVFTDAIFALTPTAVQKK